MEILLRDRDRTRIYVEDFLYRTDVVNSRYSCQQNAVALLVEAYRSFPALFLLQAPDAAVLWDRGPVPDLPAQVLLALAHSAPVTLFSSANGRWCALYHLEYALLR